MEMGKISNKDQIKPIVSEGNTSKAKPIKKKPVKESKQLSSCDEDSLKNELDKIKGKDEGPIHFSIYFKASLLSNFFHF